MNDGGCLPRGLAARERGHGDAVRDGQAACIEWRIAEATLLGWAALGGSGGALWARRHFRHKTRKQPFATMLDVIAVSHVGLALGWIVASHR